MIASCLLASRVVGQSEPVVLDTQACTSVDTVELRRILSLERRVLEAPSSESLQVELRCDSDRAQVRAMDATRELALASVPEALRPRLLALAIAELRPAPPVKVEAKAPPPAPQRFRLALSAHGQRSSLFAAGLQLSFSLRLSSWLAWASSVTFTQGTLAIDRGELRLRHASLRVGPSLQRELGRFTLAVGGGVRAGWLGLRGLPDDGVRGRRFDTWFVAPSVFAGAAVRFARHGFVLLALDLTHTIRQVNAQVRGGRARALSPWLGGASVGVGTSW